MKTKTNALNLLPMLVAGTAVLAIAPARAEAAEPYKVLDITQVMGTGGID